MALSNKVLQENLRLKYVDIVKDKFGDSEELLRVASNKWAIPTLDEDGNEQTIIITVTVPSGTRNGDIFDPYEEEQNYSLECEQRAEKKRVAEEKKAKKIAKQNSAKKKTED